MTFPISSINNESAAYFLKGVLFELDKVQIPYCIERNYENYPNIITGDVDILIDESDINRAVITTCKIATENNWSSYIIYETHQAAHIGFYAKNFPNRFVLVIEFFSGGVWRGVNFLDAKRVIQMREKSGITWKPHPSHQSIITLVHHLLYNSVVFEKYRDSIFSLYKISPEIFKREISLTFGNKISKKIALFIESQNWLGLEKMASVLRRQLIIRALCFSLIKTYNGLKYLKHDLKGKPKGLIITIKDSDGSLFGLAKAIIDFADSWHIFIPPNRKIFKITTSELGKEMKLVKNVVNTGGIAVLICNMNYPNLRMNFNKISYNNAEIVVYREKAQIIIDVNNNNYVLKEVLDNESMASIFWNFLLNNLIQNK